MKNVFFAFAFMLLGSTVFANNISNENNISKNSFQLAN